MSQPDARSRTRERLLGTALQAAAPVLSSGELLQRVRQRLRSGVCVVLGEEGPRFFAGLIARQEEERRVRRARVACGEGGGGEVASLPALSAFDLVVGQEAVVQALRQSWRVSRRGGRR